MHPEIEQLGRLLQSQYARHRGAVAFLDESYRDDKTSGEFPFYTITATVLDVADLDGLRRKYLRIAGSNWWHTTEMFERGHFGQIRDFIALISEHKNKTLISIQIAIDSGDLELARRECLLQTASSLENMGCMFLIYERREDRSARNSDDSLFSKAKSHGLISRNFRTFAGHPRAEPLLWGPDLVGWAMRRHIALNDSKWIRPMASNIEIVSVAGIVPLKKKEPKPAAAKGSGSDSTVGPEGEESDRSSIESIARFADLNQAIFRNFESVSQPTQNPDVLCKWLKDQFPERRK